MNNLCNGKPNLVHFIKWSLFNLKKERYYCDCNGCKYKESEASEKISRRIWSISLGLSAGFIGYYFQRWTGILKWILIFITSLIMLFLEEIIHWKYAKFIKVDDKEEGESEASNPETVN